LKPANDLCHEEGDDSVKVMERMTELSIDDAKIRKPETLG